MATAATLLLAVLLAIVVVTNTETGRDRRRSEVDQAVDTGRAVAGIVDGFARDLEAVVLSAAIALGGQEWPLNQQSSGPYLRALAEQYGVLRTIFVTDAQGKVVAASTGTGVGTELATRPYMQTLLSGKPTVWGPAVAGIESGDVTLTYGRSIIAPDDSVRGFLIAAFYPPRLAERLLVSTSEDADVTLVDANAFVLHSTQRPVLSASERDLTQAPLIQLALRGQVARVDGPAALFNNERRYGVVVPVPSTGWAVAYTRPLTPLEAALRDQLITQAAQVTAAVLVIGALFVFATLRITRPIDQLARAAAAVAGGDRPSLPPIGGTPEVIALANAMGAMSEAVAQREDALKRESARRTVLAEASRSFAEAGLDLDAEVATIARKVAQFVGDGCTVFMLSDDGQGLEPAVIYHPSPAVVAAARAILDELPMRLGEGSAGHAAQTGEPMLVSDVHADAAPLTNTERKARFEAMGLHSFVSVPLRAHGRTLGVVAAWRSTTPEPYTAEDLALLREIADRAAMGIQNALLYRDAEESAAAAKRSMYAHDEFFALVSHDLKNPLATIYGTAQLVRRQVSRGVPVEGERLVTDMKAIEKAIAKANQEIDASLDMARLHMGEQLALETDTTDLVALLQGLADEYQPMTDRHTITITADTPALLGTWDGRRLERAFSNLLNNAIKYSPDGGPIEIDVRLEEEEDEEYVVVTVRDHGLGIPADALPRVFDRFYRAENVERYSGSGLGLSGVRYIVEAHLGTVSVESEERVGSTFTVRLPRPLVQEPDDDSSEPSFDPIAATPPVVAT